MPTETDRIDKKILLRAPLARVWDAITDSTQFGAWFGMKIEGPFRAHSTVRSTISPTVVDEAVAKEQKQFEGLVFELDVEDITPKTYFAFRWHPFAIEKNKDYSKEPKTLVAFALEETAEGILLTVTESGFDRVPLERRAKAFAANEGGWTLVITLIEKYLAR